MWTSKPRFHIFFIPYPSAVHHLNGVCHPYIACAFRKKTL
jgi:hypothetical protein